MSAINSFSKGTAVVTAFSTAFNSLLGPLGATIAVGTVVAGAVYAISNAISNTREELIEAGEEARSTIDDIENSYDESILNDEDSERYIELRAGVDVSTNKNISLTNDEYTEYLGLCDKIADIYPTLVTGFDAQGTAILNLGTNAEEASTKLAELLETQESIADYQIRNELDTATTGTLASISQLKEELKSYEDEWDSYQNEMDVLTDDFRDEVRESMLSSSTDESLGSFTLEFPDSGSAELIDKLQTILADHGLTQVGYSDENGTRTLRYNGIIASEEEADIILQEWYEAVDGIADIVSDDDYAATELGPVIQDLENQIAEQYNQVSSDALTSLETSQNFKELPESAQELLRNSLNNIDWESVIGDDYANFSINDYVDNYIIKPMVDAINNADVQTAINRLNALDTSEMSVTDYQKSVDEQLNAIKKAYDDAGLSDEDYEEFVVNLGFRVVDEDGNTVDTTDSLISDIKEVAEARGEDTESLGLEELTVDQLIELQAIVTADDFGQTVTEAINEQLEAAEDAVSSETLSAIDLSSLFTDSEGEATEFSKSIDTFQSDISDINDAIESLNNGEEVSLTDLYQEFDNLDQYTASAETLQEALQNLSFDKLKDLSAIWAEAISGVTDEGTRQALNDMFAELIASVDLSGYDFSNIRSQIVSNVLADTGKSDSDLASMSRMLYQLFEEYSGDENAIQIMAELSLNPDAANWTYEEWKAQIEGQEIVTIIHPTIEQESDFKATLSDDISEWYDSLSESDQALVYTISVRSDDTSLWRLTKWQQELESMRTSAQTTEESLESFYEVMRGDTDSEFSDTVNDYISQFETLQDALDQIELGSMTEQDALSLALDIPELTGYTNDMDTLRAAIQNLLATSKQDLLDAFNEQLEEMGGESTAAGKALTSLMDSVLDLYGSFDDFDIDEETEKFENLYAAMDESTSATGLTTESIENLKAMYSDLDGYDPSKLFEKTENGIHLNEEALEDLEEQYESIKKADLQSDMEELQDEYARTTAEVERLTEENGNLTSAEMNALLASEGMRSVDAIAEDIDNVGTLISQYDGLTSAYNKYIQATSASDERDSFEAVANGYEDIEELLSEGWGGDEEVESYLDLLLSAEQRTGDSYADFEKLNQVIEGTSHSLADYFTFNDDGNLTSSGLQSFLDDVNSLLGEDYVTKDGDLYNFDFSGDKLQEVADAFGTTTEFVQLMERAMIDAGFAVDMGTEYLTDYDYAASQTNATLQELIENSGIDIGVDLDYDASSMTVDELTSKIEELEAARPNIDVSTDEGQAAVEALDAEVAALENQKIHLSIEEATNSQYSLEDLNKMIVSKDYDMLKIALGIDDSELDTAIEQITTQYESEQLTVKINAAIENGESVDALLALDDTELAAALKIDTSEVDDARTQLESLDGTVEDTSITVKIDESQFEQLTVQDEEATITYTSDLETAKTDLDTFKTQVETETVEIPVGADTTQAETDANDEHSDIEGMTPAKMPISGDKTKLENVVNAAVRYIEATTAKLNVSADTSAITTALAAIMNKQYSIRVAANVSGLSSTQLTGTAHASGTAYGMWTNYRHSMGAYAGGSAQDWALPQNENALVNELGTESIVYKCDFIQ